MGDDECGRRKEGGRAEEKDCDGNGGRRRDPGQPLALGLARVSRNGERSEEAKSREGEAVIEDARI